MKITKSQLKQLVMEELSEQMPEMAEMHGGDEMHLPEAEVMEMQGETVTVKVTLEFIDGHANTEGIQQAVDQAIGSHEQSGAEYGMDEAKRQSWKRISRDRAMADIDARLKNDPKHQASEKRRKSGEDQEVIGKSYSRGHAPRGGEDEIDEGRFGRSKEPAYLKRAREEEEDKLYGKPKGDEDTIRRDPHGKRSREERSDKDSKNEGRISKSSLNSLIAEEYSAMLKEYEAWVVGDDGYLRDDEGNEVYVGGPAREWHGAWPKDKYGREKHGGGSSSYGGSSAPESKENIAKLEAALAKQGPGSKSHEFLSSIISQAKRKALSPKQKASPMIARILGGGTAKPAAPAAAPAPSAAPSAPAAGGGSPMMAKAKALVAQKPELADSSTIKAIMAGKTPNSFAIKAFEKKYGVKL
jgi:hypothetical protein